jgi:hypothetical protein
MGTEAKRADWRPPIRLKLSALWASLMFCYVYGDFFGLFIQGRLAQMNKGIIGPLGMATPGTLVGVSAMMAIPALMVAFSLLLPRAISRWANVVFGLAYAAIMIVTIVPGDEPFYLFFAVIEIALCVSITWIALRWRIGESATHSA